MQQCEAKAEMLLDDSSLLSQYFCSQNYHTVVPFMLLFWEVQFVVQDLVTKVFEADNHR
jgi:hypothetical protein